MSSPESQSGERLRRQYSFDDFTLDVEQRVLRRGGEEVTLRPKSFDVLVCLLDHHGQVVTKASLMEEVWPGTTVTENSLAQCLVEIRRVLGDDSQQLIRTVARRGYLFADPVAAPVVEFPRPLGVAAAERGPLPAMPHTRRRKPLSLYLLGATALVLVLAIAGLIRSWLNLPPKQENAYTQITNFTDSALAPALSPDGRMVVFYRSSTWFHSPDQIYVKLLPNGEPVQLTKDPRLKYGVAFSPDGSRIAYAARDGPGYKTFTVSPLGAGEPTLLLSNAAGLTWLDERRVMFSEIGTGINMGVVTATENRSEYRPVYFPEEERGMAHLSYASPDRKWALIVEMNPVWQPCRVVPMDGSSLGRQVGPPGKCTSAAWSPDGKWMYFGAEVEGSSHLWRQRFPKGQPQQITAGTTEESGVAVAPDGRSLITSIGMRQVAVWIHDARGEHPITSQGYVSDVTTSGLFGTLPTFSRDGRLIYYLRRESLGAATELWRNHLESGKSESLAPGFSMLEYDVSSDGKEVLFSTRPPGKPSQIWLASLERNSRPRLVASSGESSPHFGPEGKIVFRLTEGKTHYLAQMGRDGSGRSKVVSYPIGNVQTISPDRRWIVAITPLPEKGGGGATMAVPLAGGAPRRICEPHPIVWAPDGKFLYITFERSSNTSAGKTVAIPVPAGETFPDLPASGIRGLADASAFPGAQVIAGSYITPGPDPSVYAYVKTTVHRNLYRIPVP